MIIVGGAPAGPAGEQFPPTDLPGSILLLLPPPDGPAWAAVVPSAARGDAALLPSADEPFQVVLPGAVRGLLWGPLPHRVLTLLARLRLWPLLGRPALRLRDFGMSLPAAGSPAALALTAALASLGSEGEVRAVLLGQDRVVLQVASGHGPLALRVCAGDGPPPWQHVQSGDLSMLGDLVPLSLADGELTCGGQVVRWSAERWLPGRPGNGDRTFRVRPLGPGWAALREHARDLGGRHTGLVDAAACDRLSALAETRLTGSGRHVTAAVVPLLGAWPTGWCHGDAAPSNALWHGRGVHLVDWEGARADCPAGVDALLVEAVLLLAQGRASSTGTALAKLVTHPPADLDVAGRPWTTLAPPVRRALAVCALLVNGEAGGGPDRPPGWWQDNLTAVLAAA